MKLRSVSLFTVAFVASGCVVSSVADETVDGVVESTQQAVVSRTFLTKVQDNFQNNWQAALPNSVANDWGFISEMDKYHTRKSWTYLNGGAKSFIENTNDGHPTEGLDSVTIASVGTHGGRLSDGSWRLTMWAQGERVLSENMRLGNNSLGLSLLHLDACDVVHPGPNAGFTGWAPAFKGGLRVVTGSHGDLYDSAGHGKRYAQKLNSLQGIRQAWQAAAKAQDSRNQASAMATSRTSSADCINRFNVSLDGLTSLQRNKDSNVAWICWSLLD